MHMEPDKSYRLRSGPASASSAANPPVKDRVNCVNAIGSAGLPPRARSALYIGFGRNLLLNPSKVCVDNPPAESPAGPFSQPQIRLPYPSLQLIDNSSDASHCAGLILITSDCAAHADCANSLATYFDRHSAGHASCALDVGHWRSQG